MAINQHGSLAIDDNDKPVMGGVSSVDQKTIVSSTYDPVTRRLRVDNSGSGGSISVTDGVTTVSGVTTIDFTSGATVTNGGGGQANVAITGGGSGTPGGLNTQLQYNNSGAFGGITGAVTDGTAVSLTAAHLLNPTINGAGTGLATLAYPNTSSSATITLPTVTGTLATLAGTEALTNKSVNGVTLVNGGTSTLYLSQDGTYTTPAGTYVLPTASTSVLGGVKVDGTSITISGGVISATTGGSGTVTSVAVSGGTTGLTTSGGPITGSGTITLAGTLIPANGGTGTATAFTQGSVVFAGTSGVYSQDNANFFWDATNHRLGIGTTSPSVPFDVNGSTNISAVGARIMGDYSNATFSNRVAMQTNTANGNTNFGLLPNGTATTSALNAYSNSDPTNAAFGNFGISATQVQITSSHRGTGTTLPMVLTVQGGGTITLDTGGGVTLSSLTNGLVKSASGLLSNATAGTDYSLGTSALGTGILKSTTGTGALTIAVASDFPTLNQNTTGSAATLTTPRAINGVNFDGSAAITVTASAGTLTGTTLNSTVVTSSLTTLGSSASLPGSPTTTTQSPSDNSTKVATTAYVDAAVIGQNFKEAALVATTANLVGVYLSNVFTYTATGTNSIDGVTLALGNRVLVKNQTTTFQNGWYVVTTAGALGVAGVLTRSSDANTSGEFKAGDSSFVTSGTTQSATTWAYTGVDSPTLGTDAITYAQTAGQGSFTQGNGIAITGNSIAIDTSVTVDKTTAQTLTNKTLTAPVLSGTITGTYTIGGTPTFPSTVVTTTGTQTLTNKTLTSPQINSISNTAGALSPTIVIGTRGDGTDNVTINGGISGDDFVTISATGTDTNIDLRLLGQGTGKVTVQDGATPSKQMQVSLVGATASTTTTLAFAQTTARTVTFPDATGTVTLLGNTATGTGSVVLATSPTLVTPVLGVATATSINGNIFTTGSSTYTGTASATYTFPGATSTLARSDAAQTFTGIQTFSQIITTVNSITATSNAATVPITSRISKVTNSSAATLTITITTASAVDGMLVMVRIYDFSSVAQTLAWVNTENSTVSVPSTSNGSTTLPLTVGFQFNASTTKWRVLAVA